MNITKRVKRSIQKYALSPRSTFHNLTEHTFSFACKLVENEQVPVCRNVAFRESFSVHQRSVQHCWIVSSVESSELCKLCKRSDAADRAEIQREIKKKKLFWTEMRVWRQVSIIFSPKFKCDPLTYCAFLTDLKAFALHIHSNYSHIIFSGWK